MLTIYTQITKFCLCFLLLVFAFTANAMKIDKDKLNEYKNKLELMLKTKNFDEYFLDLVNKDLYEIAKTNLEKAKTKAGKDRLFLDFEKEFAENNRIPREYVVIKTYRQLLWKIFNNRLEIDSLDIVHHNIRLNLKEIRLAQAKNQDATILLELKCLEKKI